ncbi:MAG: hypothetical protein JWM02_536 [Frankiales bacterium]|nr:hypothetical protein [Frankiales bacterium]
MTSLRSTLYVQAALTALYGLTRSDGVAWTLLTMVIAAGAVFVGAALQPIPSMRTGLLAFEGIAVAFGAVGVTAHHYVPGTVIAVFVLVRLFGPDATRAFTDTPSAGLSVSDAPAASPFEYPAAQAAPAVPAWTPAAPVVPTQPLAAGEPVGTPSASLPAGPAVPATAVPTMTILPR